MKQDAVKGPSSLGVSRPRRWRWRAWLAAGLLSFGAATAGDKALIMGIADYPGAGLPGVRKDMVSARAIARSLGVADNAMVVRQDSELTLVQLRRTLQDFAATVQSGDRAFIYFSGHGSRYAAPDGACDAALVSRDLKMLGRRELDALLQPMLQRAAKTVVMFDTCHSGAVLGATRDVAASVDPDAPRGRFLRSGGDACAVASNVVTSRGEGAVAAPPNHYLLASAADTEVAIDGGLRDGGYATTALTECLSASGSELDANRDGLATLSELRACAQRRIDTKIRTERARSPRFEFVGQTLTETIGPGGDMPIATPSAAPGLPAAALNSAVDARALLDTLHRSRDGTRQVTLELARSEFRIGVDLLDFTVTSAQPGYLFLFAVGASGKIDLLFPNRLDAAHQVDAGQAVRLPREGWRLRSRGPAGVTALLAVVTDGAGWANDLGTVAGPFSRIDNRADAVKQLANRLLIESRCLTPSGSPGAAPQRDFGLEATGCTARFGAARAEVSER